MIHLNRERHTGNPARNNDGVSSERNHAGQCLRLKRGHKNLRNFTSIQFKVSVQGVIMSRKDVKSKRHAVCRKTTDEILRFVKNKRGSSLHRKVIST